jgi:hypothetical protein
MRSLSSLGVICTRRGEVVAGVAAGAVVAAGVAVAGAAVVGVDGLKTSPVAVPTTGAGEATGVPVACAALVTFSMFMGSRYLPSSLL